MAGDVAAIAACHSVPCKIHLGNCVIFVHVSVAATRASRTMGTDRTGRREGPARRNALCNMASSEHELLTEIGLRWILLVVTA